MKRSATVLAIVAVLSLGQLAGAGPVGGSFQGMATVPDFGTQRCQVVCWGGQATTVEVVGDGNSDLNIILFDSQGRQLARTWGAGDRCRVTWYAPRNAVYYIWVVNEGPGPNTYTFTAR